MLHIVIAALFVMMEKCNGGYIYPRPNIAFYLPKTESGGQGQIQQQTIQVLAPQQTFESVVSNATPLQNSYALDQSQGNFQSNSVHTSFSEIISPTAPPTTVNQEKNVAFNLFPQHSIPAINTPSVKLSAPSNILQSILATNTREPANIPLVNIPVSQNVNSVGDTYSHVIPNIPTVNIIPSIKEQSHSGVNAAQHIGNIAGNIPNPLAPIVYQSNPGLDALNIIPDTTIPASIQLQSNLEFTNQLQIIDQGDNTLNAPLSVQNVVSPVITKDIYFHVPPPEIEEQSVRTVTPKIKNYKIIFIKAPSHERRNIAQLQGNGVNQVAPIEEKTIIYVLSKKPTSEEVFLPKPVPSEHEVFFVKYNGDTGTAVSQLSDNVE